MRPRGRASRPRRWAPSASRRRQRTAGQVLDDEHRRVAPFLESVQDRHLWMLHGSHGACLGTNRGGLAPGRQAGQRLQHDSAIDDACRAQGRPRPSHPGRCDAAPRRRRAAAPAVPRADGARQHAHARVCSATRPHASHSNERSSPSRTGTARRVRRGSQRHRAPPRPCSRPRRGRRDPDGVCGRPSPRGPTSRPASGRPSCDAIGTIVATSRCGEPRPITFGQQTITLASGSTRSASSAQASDRATAASEGSSGTAPASAVQAGTPGQHRHDRRSDCERHVRHERGRDSRGDRARCTSAASAARHTASVR